MALTDGNQRAWRCVVGLPAVLTWAWGYATQWRVTPIKPDLVAGHVLVAPHFHACDPKRTNEKHFFRLLYIYIRITSIPPFAKTGKVTGRGGGHMGYMGRMARVDIPVRSPL